MGKQWTEEEVVKLLNILNTINVDSLDRPVSNDCEDNPLILGDSVLDEGPGPQELAERSDRNRILNEAVSKLKPREAMIIQMRYGLKDGQFKTLDECGAYFGVTRERIRQVETKAMRKLKWIILHKYKLKPEDL